MRLNLKLRCKAERFVVGLPIAVLLCAQVTPPPSQDEIVITGERFSRDEARQRAASYVRATGVAVGASATARWIDPICPRVLGIDAKLAKYVEERIRAFAKAVDAPLASKPCTANAVVSFVSDAASTAKRVSELRPRQFSEVDLSAREALLKGDAPIRWWYSTEVRGKDGDRLLGMEPPFVRVEGGTPGAALPGSGKTSFLSLYSNSIISTQTVRAVRSATVLIDVNRAAGAKLDAVADYAAFVVLAEVRPRTEPQPTSILGLFTGETRPSRLTDLDAKFMRELYRLPLDRRARQQRAALVNALIDDRPLK